MKSDNADDAPAMPQDQTDPVQTFSSGTEGPDFSVPENACDCHMHFFDDSFPFVRDAVLRPPNAGADAYQRLQRRLGLTRNVLVQPSPYGLDNRLLIRSLAELGETARGVAVVNDQVSRESLNELHAAGARGARFNLVQRGATSVAMLERVAELVEPLGWHLQLHMTPSNLLANHQLISSLPVHVVFDHMARFATEPNLKSELQGCLLSMLRGGKTWIKLSAPYLASQRPDEGFADLSAFIEELVREFPRRLVWATDWPHVTESTKPDDGALMSLLSRWIRDPSVLECILVDNPATLYDF